VQLIDLAEINHSRGFGEGDATLQSVAATVQRAAARCQGLAFRASGRRIAVLGPGLDQPAADQLRAVLLEELGAGPAIRVGAAAWRTGEDGEQVIDRALHAAQQSATIAA